MEWYPLDSKSGMVSNLFHHLWRKNSSGMSCPNVAFPDTVIFRLNRPFVWCVRCACPPPQSQPTHPRRRPWCPCDVGAVCCVTRGVGISHLEPWHVVCVVSSIGASCVCACVLDTCVLGAWLQVLHVSQWRLVEEEQGERDERGDPARVQQPAQRRVRGGGRLHIQLPVR